jgi:hypothetical protein
MESYDVEPPFERRLEASSPLRVGDRHDWYWARVVPPLQVGPHPSLRTTLDLDIVAVAPRHLGATWDSGRWPMHVYVCRVIDPAKSMAPDLQADDLSIEYWATLAPLDDTEPTHIHQR